MDLFQDIADSPTTEKVVTLQKKKAIALPERIELAVATILNLITQGYALAMTYSSGKDSSSTTLLCLEAIRRAKLAGVVQARHFVSSSTTSVENPSIENYLLQMHEDIQRWVAKHDLPVDVRMVQPNAATRFMVNTIGRGSLPRFVENGKHRTCTQDWKVKPQQRLARQLREESLSNGFKETISVLGVRLDESASRGARMRVNDNQAHTPTRNADGFLTLSLIADWSVDDVFEFLFGFLEEDLAPFPAYVIGGAVRTMLDLYRDGNEQTCGMFEQGPRKPCQSRFGCWTCTVTGSKDRSMESLLASDPKYAYMQGLSDFRNFLVATQWDLDRRELVGRKLSAAGYLPVRHDVYSLEMRRDLLSYILTLDELERERAEKLDGDMVTGLAPDTPENQRMRFPQFEHISVEDIVLIDFWWSLHHFAANAFPALQVWFDIKVLGRRRKVPKLDHIEAGSIPPKRWFKVDRFNAEVPTDGLRDYKAEQWNRYRHPERPMSFREINGERTVWFDEQDSLQVDCSKAVLFIDSFCTTALQQQSQSFEAIESARFWLNEEIVLLPKGMIAKYQHIAKRGQYFSHLAQRLNLTPAELNEYLATRSISEAEHTTLLGFNAADDTDDSQADMFEELLDSGLTQLEEEDFELDMV